MNRRFGTTADLFKFNPAKHKMINWQFGYCIFQPVFMIELIHIQKNVNNELKIVRANVPRRDLQNNRQVNITHTHSVVCIHFKRLNCSNQPNVTHCLDHERIVLLSVYGFYVRARSSLLLCLRCDLYILIIMMIF